MRGDKESIAAGLLVAATATISCAAQQDLVAPREIRETAGATAAELPVTQVIETSPGNSSCSNGRLSLRERFRAWKLRKQESCLGYPEEFNERPLGAAIHDTFDKQRANGEAALM